MDDASIPNMSLVTLDEHETMESTEHEVDYIVVVVVVGNLALEMDVATRTLDHKVTPAERDSAHLVSHSNSQVLHIPPVHLSVDAVTSSTTQPSLQFFVSKS